MSGVLRCALLSEACCAAALTHDGSRPGTRQRHQAPLLYLLVEGDRARDCKDAKRLSSVSADVLAIDAALRGVVGVCVPSPLGAEPFWPS